MIKTLRDFREALDKMMEELVYGTKGHIQADAGQNDILISSPNTPDLRGEISMGVIFIPSRNGDAMGEE